MLGGVGGGGWSVRAMARLVQMLASATAKRNGLCRDSSGLSASFLFVLFFVDLLFNADQQHKHYFTVMFEKSVCVEGGRGGGGQTKQQKQKIITNMTRAKPSPSV